MPNRRKGPFNGHGKRTVGPSRRTLNAFRIDKGDDNREAHEADETLHVSDEGVRSDDDEDIDSDGAFDESDEEKFSTFKFSGSNSKRVRETFPGMC
jgi:U3 small nucleolar RNA-associated protein 14